MASLRGTPFWNLYFVRVVNSITPVEIQAVISWSFQQAWLSKMNYSLKANCMTNQIKYPPSIGGTLQEWLCKPDHLNPATEHCSSRCTVRSRGQLPNYLVTTKEYEKCLSSFIDMSVQYRSKEHNHIYANGFSLHLSFLLFLPL